MKKKLGLLLVLGFITGAAYAQTCPCDDGTSEYSVDCDGDGVNDACSTEDCGPCVAGNEASEGKECCGNVEYVAESPWEFTPYSIDLQAASEAYDAAKNIFTTIGPCDQSGGGLPTISTEIGFRNECCNDEVTDKYKFQGTASWNFGTIECEWPLFGIPYVGTVNAVGSLGANVSISLSGTQTCEDTEICADGTFGVTAGGGGSLTAIGDLISFSGTLNVALEATAEWCEDSGFTAEVGMQSITLVGEAEFVWISRSISFTVWES